MIDPEPGPPRIGVGAIIFDPDDRVLLIRRNTAPALGRWSVPGGKQEAGETLVQACQREVFEETGLAITIGPIVAVVERILDGFHYVIIDFLARTNNTGVYDVYPASDVSDARWVGGGDLRAYDLVEGLAAIIAVSRILNSGTQTGGLRTTNGTLSDFVAQIGHAN
jgi:8-oxo-dGTP diphosphatase